MFLRRRHLIATTGLAAASLGLPRIAIGQADRRPSITIAVQQIANSASLEPLREQSNVGQRVFSFIYERLITQNLLGKLEEMPGLAESWKRIDERTVEFTLRKGVKFHNGDEMTADDVVFTFSRERMFGPDYDITSNKTLFTSVLIRDSVRGQEAAARGARRRQAPVPRPREGRGDRQVHGALHQPHARRHPRRPHRPHGQRHRLAPRLRARPRAGWNGRGRRCRPAPTRCASSCPTSR